VTEDAVPALHKFVVGALVTATPLAEPHAPLSIFVAVTEKTFVDLPSDAVPVTVIVSALASEANAMKMNAISTRKPIPPSLLVDR
jgi:hypothetical protein